MINCNTFLLPNCCAAKKDIFSILNVCFFVKDMVYKKNMNLEFSTFVETV